MAFKAYKYSGNRAELTAETSDRKLRSIKAKLGLDSSFFQSLIGYEDANTLIVSLIEALDNYCEQAKIASFKSIKRQEVLADAGIIAAITAIKRNSVEHIGSELVEKKDTGSEEPLGAFTEYQPSNEGYESTTLDLMSLRQRVSRSPQMDTTMRDGMLSILHSANQTLMVKEVVDSMFAEIFPSEKRSDARQSDIDFFEERLNVYLQSHATARSSFLSMVSAKAIQHLIDENQQSWSDLPSDQREAIEGAIHTLSLGKSLKLMLETSEEGQLCLTSTLAGSFGTGGKQLIQNRRDLSRHLDNFFDKHLAISIVQVKAISLPEVEALRQKVTDLEDINQSLSTDLIEAEEAKTTELSSLKEEHEREITGKDEQHKLAVEQIHSHYDSILKDKSTAQEVTLKRALASFELSESQLRHQLDIEKREFIDETSKETSSLRSQLQTANVDSANKSTRIDTLQREKNRLEDLLSCSESRLSEVEK